MTVPNFLNSSFSFLETTGITDVATIITDFRDEVLNQQTPAWTEPSAGQFKTPVDDDSRFFQITLTRNAATDLRIDIEDVIANDVMGAQRRIDISGAGQTVRYFTGQYYCYVEVVATDDRFFAGMLDNTPESNVIHGTHTYGYAFRNTAGTGDSTTGEWTRAYMYDDSTATLSQRLMMLRNQNYVTVPKTGSGAYFYYDQTVAADFGSENRIAGRMYNVYQGPVVSDGAEQTVPIDDSTNATFKQVSQTSVNNRVIWIRKS